MTLSRRELLQASLAGLQHHAPRDEVFDLPSRVVNDPRDGRMAFTRFPSGRLL